MSTQQLFCWNVRGFNKFGHRNGFKKWTKVHKPIFGGLIETHVKRPKMQKFVNELLPGWLFEDNYNFSDLGKIWILWHPSVLVSVVQKSLQMVTCDVTIPGHPPFLASIVYASNCHDEMKELWDSIMQVGASLPSNGKPWIVLGDFNQTLSPEEHSLNSSSKIDKRMRLFRDCLLEADLQDLNFRGNTFTWWNKSKLRPIAKKLDRALVNDDWGNSFPTAVATFESPDFSDHSPISISLSVSSPTIKRPFRFFNFLLQNNEFLPMIAEKWFSINVTGSAMLRVSKKLKQLKKHIRDFSRLNYSGIELRTKEAHEVLLNAQSMTLADPSVANAEWELTCARKWQALAKAEEGFHLQRASVTCLGLGDANSTYYHRLTSVRRSANHIHYLFDSDGTRIEDQAEIEEHCVDYFSNLLGGPVSQQQFEQSDLDLLYDFSCSEEETAGFCKDFTALEVQEAFFSLPRNKASGPDGYTAEFYKSAWSIIGPEVTQAVLEFFYSGNLLKQWNATTMVLIPKITNASSTADFRPISCLNTVYKVISKLLASRLKMILPQVISQSQSAFMPGRLLAENVLLATDLVQGYNTANSSPRAMLKVDLRKAFDTIRWDFIIDSLKALSIPLKFIRWVYQCISTASFTISVNGSSSGHFGSTNGIRQGDPISPYIFVLAMEALSRLLLSRFESGMIGYHPMTSDLKLSHLMFADDVMIFFDGNPNSLHGISDCLDDFGCWSGLNLNRTKTEVFTSGLTDTETHAINAYGFNAGTLPIRYLGLPLMSRKLRISDYDPLLYQLTKKFRSWAVKSLTFAGRLVLLNTVVTGIVNFWISTFMLPKGCIRKIDSLCSRFLWSGNIDEFKTAKIAWATCCLPKDEGGLGLRSFSALNRVLLLRFIWLLFSGSKSLWVQWQLHYRLSSTSFWAVIESTNDSWTWRQLLKLRCEALNFCRGILNSGRKLSFWYDVWTPLGQLLKYMGPSGPRALRIPLLATVSEACNSEIWLLAQPRSQAALDIHIHLTTISLPLVETEDEYEWKVEGSTTSTYSTADTWDYLRPRAEKRQWVDCVWFKGHVPKLAFNMWIANADRMPTRVRLASWGLQIPTTCCLCAGGLETRDHLLLTCPFSREVWHLVLSRLNPPSHLFTDWNELLSWIRSPPFPSSIILRKLAVQSTVYHLWRQRNNVYHNNIIIPPAVVARMIYREVKNTVLARRDRKQFRNLLSSWLI